MINGFSKFEHDVSHIHKFNFFNNTVLKYKKR